MWLRRLEAVALALLIVTTSVPLFPIKAEIAQATIASHHVSGWGFRDELNRSDTDYQNFWTDNAGKILASSVIVNDQVDSDRALEFIESHMTSSYYLPELLVNSSVIRPSIVGEDSSVSNRIVITGVNEQRPELQQLSMGDFYAGPWIAGYLGADRIWYNGSSYRAVSASLTALPNGFVKRSFFSLDGVSFYTYLNATVSIGDPYVAVSLQVEPLDSTFGFGDHVYLQAFAGPETSPQYAFENATLFDAGGGLVEATPYKGAVPLKGSGMLVAYSNRTSTLTQDSVALRFNSTGVYDAEHWYADGAFGGLSWTGLGYDVPATSAGALSAPVYAEVWPIQHLDFRLLTDTMRYMASNPKDVSVAPPVSFGFVARGLALELNSHPDNKTLERLAKGYWSLYYQRYSGTVPSTAYARAVNVFAIAGFELYGANSSVEGFAKRFVGGFPGASIEEFGWAEAALQTLDLYNSSASTIGLYQEILGSFIVGTNRFVEYPQVAPPDATYQFAEAAAGLLTAKVPYNNSAVLWAMNAVFQSNVSGVLLNQPYRGDLANTETIPAYELATWLFENSMRSSTGYWIVSIQGANITRIAYSAGSIDVEVNGRGGSVEMGTPGGLIVCTGINGPTTLPCSQSSVPWAWVLLAGIIGVEIIVAVWFLFLKGLLRRA